MGTIARSMPQLGLLMILVLLPLQMLSGGSTPRESMPQAVQDIMLTMPTTHFVSLAQAILYRGAGFEYRLAAVPDPAGDRRRVLPDSAVTLQKNDWHNGVNIIAGWRLRLIRPTNDRRASVGRASEAPPALVFFRQTLQVAVAHAALGDNIIGKMLYVAHIALQNGDLQTVIVVDMDVQRGDG